MSEIEIIKIAILWEQFARNIGICPSGEFWTLGAMDKFSDEDLKRIEDCLNELP